MPHASAGMRGRPVRRLFDPPHEGHRLSARSASRRLGLDQVWWMVTPGNPLKDHRLAPLAARIALREAIAAGSAHQGDRFRGGAGHSLHRRHAGDRRPARRTSAFVWMMGADNLRDSTAGRTGSISPRRSDRRLRPAGLHLRATSPRAWPSLRLCPPPRGRCQVASPFRRAPAWTFIHGPLLSMSSSAFGPPRQSEIE